MSGELSTAAEPVLIGLGKNILVPKDKNLSGRLCPLSLPDGTLAFLELSDPGLMSWECALVCCHSGSLGRARRRSLIVALMAVLCLFHREEDIDDSQALFSADRKSRSNPSKKLLRATGS